MQEQLARDLIQNINDAKMNANVLGAMTGDEDFGLLALMLETMLIAKAKGELDDFAQAISKVMAQKNAAQRGGSAIADIIDTFDGLGN